MVIVVSAADVGVGSAELGVLSAVGAAELGVLSAGGAAGEQAASQAQLTKVNPNNRRRRVVQSAAIFQCYGQGATLRGLSENIPRPARLGACQKPKPR